MKDEQIHRLSRGQTRSVGDNAEGRTSSGVPLHVARVEATESPSKQGDRMYSLVSVTFLRDPNDSAFQGVRIWFTGYQGSNGRTLVADGHDSPVNFLVESTGETVVVTVQAVGGRTAADIGTAPTTTVVLDGVTSAPASPTVTQQLVSIPNGYQFTFRPLTGLAADVIEGYWIYRDTTSTTPTPPTSRFQYVPHSTAATSSDGFVFQDTTVTIGSTYYYWVSAVNTSGLESSLSAAQSGATLAGAANLVEGSYAIVPVSGSSCLSSVDEAVGASISVAAFDLYSAYKPSGLRYNAQVAKITTDSDGNGILNSTVYAVFCDDVTLAGGSQTYQACKNRKTLVLTAGRFLIDTITTAANGGGGTGGGGAGGGGTGGGGGAVNLP